MTLVVLLLVGGNFLISGHFDLALALLLVGGAFWFDKKFSL